MAYYSSEGAIINQGAGSIGEYFVSLGQFTQARAGGGGIHARDDGSLGAPLLRSMATLPRMQCHADCYEEYQAGFWTAKGLSVCCGARPPEAPKSWSWQDWESCVQGARRGNRDAVECLLHWYRLGYITAKGFKMVTGFSPPLSARGGPRVAMRGLGEYMEMPSQEDAYEDGVFADFSNLSVGPLESYQEGSLGIGQVAMPTTLDLKDPQSVKETKTAIGIASGAMAQQYLEKWNEEFYASEIWDERATELWRFFLTFIKTKLPAVSTTYTDAQLTVSTSKGEYPTATGLLLALTTGVGSPAFPGNPNYFATNFPKLSAWMQTVAAAGGQGQVLEPNFTFGETVKGKPGALKMSTVAWFGFGATALVVGYLYFKKRRPAA